MACKGDIETDVMGRCHNNTIDKCTTYGPDGGCLRCQPSYSLSKDGKCVKSFTGCINEGGPG